VPVKFKLLASSNCKQPLITDAVAILSVALIADSSGKSTFMPIGLVSNGSSGLAQPLFKADNNQQYLFNWDKSSCIMPSGAVQTCPSGLYSLTVSFLTDFSFAAKRFCRSVPGRLVSGLAASGCHHCGIRS
jgi:hypothetical protein